MTLVLLGCGLGVVSADAIHLEREAAGGAYVIRLGDVAELEGADAEALADIEVGRFDDGSDVYTLTADRVRQKLAEAGVNWADFSLMGFATVTVHRGEGGADPAASIGFLDDPAVSLVASPAIAGSLVANPDQPVEAVAPVSLRDLILQRLTEETGIDSGELVLHMEPRDERFLGRPMFGQRFSVQLERAGAGWVAVVSPVTRQVEERPRRIRMQVLRSASVLVSTRPLRRGDVLRPDQLEVRELEIPLQDRGYFRAIDQAGGLVAGKSIAAGEPLSPEDLMAEEVVQRGDLVHVVCQIGGIRVKTVAIARDSGAVGDTIALRSSSSTRTFYAVVTGRRQALVETPETLALGDAR